MTTSTLGRPNALANGLRVLGDEWAMLIIQRGILGDRRYTEFKDALGISDAVLTQRLRELTELGVLRPVGDPAGRTTAYPVGRIGRDLWQVLLMIWDWEQAWSPASAPLPVMRHRSCGAVFRPVLSCGSCEMPCSTPDLMVRWGPEGGWDRSIPRGGRRRRGSGPGLFAATMGVVGNHWSLAVLVAALWGTRRYGDFQSTLSMSPAILSERLRTLVGAGFLAEHPSAQRSDWLEYRPTARATALLPVFALMVTWAERWFGRPDSPSVLLEHRACGESLLPHLLCDRCHQTVFGADVLVAESTTPQADSPQPHHTHQ
ncbi:MAG: helix-turn-helix domain-containing protein [Actinomycetia bacterium]|nr:helix-turn-helix domain-containing protein [Actinomycetes bacterium]